MKVLFCRPPRYRWPFHSEKSSFWQPLGFASMAAVLRNNLDVDVQILDCPVLKMGWKSTKKRIREIKPHILCVGEETVSAHEALKLVEFTKSIFPDCVVIAGGSHFTYVIDTLDKYPIDYIVKFEGEETLLELVTELQKGPKPNINSLKEIKGIAFKRDKIYETELRELLDMEKLPMPAYDLLPMELYGKGAKSHPNLVAIEHSRGCNCSCNFCILWKQMGKISKDGVKACYRTKSPEKTFEEVRFLAEKYNRKTFCWVDPTWNVDAKWNEEFSNLMIESGLEVDHSVWLRADYVVRDEEKGIFSKQVRAGVKQAMIGIERTDNDDLAYLEKSGYSFSTTKKAFEIIRKYPSVLSIGTYIFGLPNETRESLFRFFKYLRTIPFDVGVSIPLTPNPGTKYFDDLEKQNLIEVRDFRYYNFVNLIARSKYLSRNKMMFYNLLDGIYSGSKPQAEGRRERAIINLGIAKASLLYRFPKALLYQLIFRKPYNYNIKPSWYES